MCFAPKWWCEWYDGVRPSLTFKQTTMMVSVIQQRVMVTGTLMNDTGTKTFFRYLMIAKALGLKSHLYYVLRVYKEI
jgi:hypothetical protein